VTWIRVETNMVDSDRTIAFAEGCGISAETAAGFLCRLWGRIAEHRPDGDLRGMSNAAIEQWAGWVGMPTVLATQFRKGYMDNEIVVAWLDDQGKLAARAAADRLRKIRGNATEKVPLRNVTDTERLVASSDARAREGLTVAYEVACVVALNDANREHLAGQHPDEVPASGQVGLVQWEAEGIPLDLVVRTIRETVARYRPTPRNRYPRSLKYFDAAVRDAHECTRQRAAPSAAAGRPVVRQDADGVTRVVAHG
jgi:hypothetical protein